MDKFDAAKIQLADGRVGYDALKLVEIPVEGIKLSEYRNHKIVIQTKNTRYVLTTRNDRVLGQAFAENGEPRHLSKEREVNVHGSTYGGSMIRIGFIGVNMHLELSAKDPNHPDPWARTLTTTAIQSITVRELPNE